MAMYESVITVVVATICGGLAGGIAGRFRRRTVDRQPIDQTIPSFDPATEAWIDQAAKQWATAHGRPEAETVIANKLRLGTTLQERRQPRRFR